MHLICISGLQLHDPVNFTGVGVVSRQIIQVGTLGCVCCCVCDCVFVSCNGFTELRGFYILTFC